MSCQTVDCTTVRKNKRIIKICKEEEGFLHEKYVGKCFYKWFLSMNGVGAEFVGTVTEIWWGTDQKTFFARVVYEDGDREDMSLSELISLVENDSSESNDFAGVCEPYVGTACSKYIGQDYVFVSQGLTQSYIEQKLQVSIP